MKRLVLGLFYLGMFTAEAVRSYYSPIYRFHGTGMMLVISVLGVAATMVWWRRKLTRLDWALPVALVLVGLMSFPDTSRDHLRYLLDGEMIRLWHLSPYVHLPGEFPHDQYVRAIGVIWWTHIPSPYGPLWQAVMTGINWVTGNQIAAGVIVLKLLNLAGLLMCARYLYLISGKAYISYVFLINPIILIDTVATPHTDIVLAAALLAAYYHRSMPGRGILLGSVGLIKVHALIFAPFNAKSWRELVQLLLWMTATLGILLVVLKPVVGFEWLPMLTAGQSGGVTATESLLMYGLLPGLPKPTLFLASYGLFMALYAAIAVAYARCRVTALEALTLTSFLVPLCLTGVLLPWHFVIPLAFLLLNTKRPPAYWAVLLLILLVLRSAITVPELLKMAAIFGLGGWAAYAVYCRVSRPPGWATILVNRLR